MSSCARLVLLLILFALPSALRAADDPDPKAEAALQKLRERLDDPKVNRERLRQELLALRQAYPGTPQAVQAAVLLSRLPSPLDKLDPAKIPVLERFDWQPPELVAVLHEHRGRQGSHVYAVAVSPDGKRAASGGNISLVRLWDMTTMRLLENLGGPHLVYSLLFSPDGKTLAVGSGGGVYLWDVTVTPAKLGAVLRQGLGSVHSLAFAPGGKRLAFGSGDGHVYVWDGPWNAPPKEPATSYIGPTQPVTGLAFTLDGKTLAAGASDGDLKLYDPQTEPLKVLATVPAHPPGVTALAFDPTAVQTPLLASTGIDGKLCFWKLVNNKLKLDSTLAGKNGVLYSLAFTPDGKTLAYGAQDGTIHLLSVKTRQDRAVVKGHPLHVSALAYAKGQHLISGSYDWTVRRWDDIGGAKPTQKTVTSGHLALAYAAAFAPDDSTLLTGGEDNTLRLWDVGAPAAREKGVLPSPQRVYAVAYFPDGQRAAAAGGNNDAQIWDLVGRRLALQLKGHKHIVSSIAVAPDGKQILTGSHDKTMRLWDTRFGKELHLFDGPTTVVNMVAFAPDGRRAAAASGNYLYDEKGKLVVKGGVLQYDDCTVRVWDLPDGSQPRKLTGHTMHVYITAFAPDGKELVSGGVDQTLRFWSADGTELGKMPLKGHLWGLAHSADARLLATVTSDAKVVVRDRVQHKVLHEWQMKETPRRVIFAADSRHLAVTFDTGVVYILRLASM
jgi:WD40 repeat protein